METYTMASDGANVTRLTDNVNNVNVDARPAWSPNGAKIAFETTRDGNREIYAMNADGSGQTKLTSEPDSRLRPGLLARWLQDRVHIGS